MPRKGFYKLSAMVCVIFIILLAVLGKIFTLPFIEALKMIGVFVASMLIFSIFIKEKSKVSDIYLNCALALCFSVIFTFAQAKNNTYLALVIIFVLVVACFFMLPKPHTIAGLFNMLRAPVIIVLCMSLSILVMSQATLIPSKTEGYLVAQKAEVKKPEPLTENWWGQLTIEQRIASLEEIECFEANDAGRQAFGVISFTPQADIKADISFKDKTIKISDDVLANGTAKEAVSLLLHEERHIYQVYIINNIEWNNFYNSSRYFDELRAWKSELTEYNSLNSEQSEFEKYTKTGIEENANWFVTVDLSKYFSEG